MFVWIHNWSVLLWGFSVSFFDNYNYYYFFLLCFVINDRGQNQDGGDLLIRFI